MPKKILIVGSGENYCVKDFFDFYYCANGSISRIPSHFDNKIIHVNSANMFLGSDDICLTKNSNNKKIRQKNIKNRSPFLSYIYPSEYPIHKQKKTMFFFQYNPGKIYSLTFPELRNIVKSAVGLRIYFRCWASKKYSIRSIKDVIRAIMINKPVVSEFKPSTGMLALLIAINQHGKNAAYYTTGLLRTHNFHWYGDTRIYNKIFGHLNFDSNAMLYIKNKYDITIIDR